MRKTLIFFAICISCFGIAQPSPDILETDLGEVEIYPVLHGTLVLKWDKHTVYIDPYGGKKVFKDYDDPNLILITGIRE